MNLPEPYRWVGDVACATLRSDDGRYVLPIAISRVEMAMAPDHVAGIMAAREAMARRRMAQEGRPATRPLEPYVPAAQP